MKIRIFALANELGLDSKELIEHCNSAGVKLKHSALASISPEQRDIVLEYLKKQKVTGPGSAAAETLAPTRDAGRAIGGRVREIRTMTPRPQNGRGAADADVAESAARIGEGDSSHAAATDGPAAPTDKQPAAARSAAPAAGDQAQPKKPGDSERPEREILSRMSRSGIREMRPIGTVPDSEARQQRKGKAKAKPSLPNIATPPSYKPPKSKTPAKQDEPVQRPEIPLTAEAFEQQSPLKAHMQDKKRRKQLAEDEGFDREKPPGRGGRGPLGGEGEVRRQRRERRIGTRTLTTDEDVGDVRAPKRTIRRRRPTGTVALKTSAQIEMPITVRGLSEAMGRPAKDLLRILFERGEMATINDVLTEDVALELAMEMGVELEIRRERDIEQELSELFESGDEAAKVARPPIITILGHVDHGKTTLLDKIRSANVAEGEAGGITQHIAAYQVEHNGQKLTFVDTPGHAAFGEMRARGANVTDIVVLVVAADDGVMPQTEECISHAKAAGVPIVVALNKIDLPGVNEQRILQQLAAHELLPVEWGGDTEVVRTSGVTGKGLDQLLDTLLITAELREFSTDPERPAAGVCLEAFRDEGRGPLAWLVVQTGTLRVGDIVLCGDTYGRIRALYSDRDEELPEAGPSTPVKVAGLASVPDAGEHFWVPEDLDAAREAAETRHYRGRTRTLSNLSRPRSLEDILAQARGGEVQDLPLILKADTPGSLEALRGELGKLDHPEVRVQIVHAGVGGVNESDVALAHASGATIIAFHVIAEERARQAADRGGIDIRRYEIIYEITDTIRQALEGLLRPERVEVVTGRALVLQTFKISRFGVIAGCRVLNGAIERTSRVHVIRDQAILNDYAIASLKRGKDDAREVREGMECGIRLDGFNDVKEGDLLEAYKIDEIKRTLDG